MANIIDRLKIKPQRILVLGIALVMLIGAFLLNLPISSVERESVGFINALFTSISATSVTGLVVVNTAQYWSLFGKFVILCLIQIGGLGFMTLTSLIAMILGKKIGLRDRLIIQEELNQFNLAGIVRFTKYVIKATFIVELIGAIILATRFIPQYGVQTGIVFSIFHAVSAYCNAGFDLLGDSLIRYVGDPLVVLTISALIVLGGIGYTVYLDITKNKGFKKLTMHTRFAIRITLFLIIIGTAFIFISEYDNVDTLSKLSLDEKVLASILQSITTRTAGFNSINLGHINATTAFCMIILMFIGGSPSSTAGGIKTTTFGTLVVAVISMIKGRKEVEVLNRTIPTSLVLRALAVFLVSAFLVVGVIMILTITESQEFLDIMYEVVSAFSTCGVTRGITPELTDTGKIIIMSTMYIGKVGPLTLAFAIASRSKNRERKFRYPEGKLLIG